jgi:hypothetical protein
MMTKEQRDELRRLEQAATKGVFVAKCDRFGAAIYTTVDARPELVMGGELRDDGHVDVVADAVDMALIAAARNALPQLLDDLDAKDAEIERLRAELTPTSDADLYYIASFKHGFVGNDVLFWAKPSGYTCILEEAATYSRTEALRLHADNPYDATYMLPASWVRAHQRTVIEIQRAGGKSGMIALSREAAEKASQP